MKASRAYARIYTIVFISISLTACFGVGGNSRSSNSTLTGFQTLSPNSRYQLENTQIQEGQSFTSDRGTIIDIDTDSSISTTTTLTFITNADSEIAGLSFTTPAGSISDTSQRQLRSWITGNPVTDDNNAWLQNSDVLLFDSEQRVGTTERSVPRSIVGISNSLELGHDYQTYGVWTEFETISSGQSGTFSAGLVSQQDAIPSQGSATYTGTVIGDYVGDATTAGNITTGGHYTATADMTAVADFDNSNIAFTTTNTKLSADFENVLNTPELDLSGQLTISSTTNQFTGTIDNSATGGDLTGDTVGRFYGPEAEELGGTFSLSDGSAGPITETYTGAFGGKRN